MKKRTDHNDYIDVLERRFGKSFDSYERNVEYEKNGVYGEIDFIGVKDGIFYIYEVKCNGGKRQKAIEQLRRAEKFLKRRCRKFYYVGRDDFLTEI